MSIQDAEYELFRRAVQERDSEAWTAIATQYRRLLIAWAAQCQASRMASESYEDLADRALARAWAALTPERFTGFPSLPALLAYLRRCVTATAIDTARSYMAQERAVQQASRATPAPMDQAVIERLDRAELWRILGSLIRTETERVVLVERFVQDLPPRQILARHPELFADATEIYGAVRNLCERLRRNAELRRLYDERWAA